MRLIVATALAALFAFPAFAQGCGPREAVISTLAEKYGETRKGIGVAGQGAVMELWASEETGTWTITVTTPNGRTCLVGSGQHFEALDESLIEGDPA